MSWWRRIRRRDPARSATQTPPRLPRNCDSWGWKRSTWELPATTRLRSGASILEGLRRDVLIVTGGVSVGAYDFVEEILREAGWR